MDLDEFAQFEKAVCNYTQSRVVGLCFSYENNEEQGVELGSGFFMMLEGKLVYITAGHVLRKLETATRVHKAFFVLTINEHEYVQIEVKESDYLPMICAEEAKWFDIGAMIMFAVDESMKSSQLRLVTKAEVYDGDLQKLRFTTLAGFPWDSRVQSAENPELENAYGGSIFLPGNKQDTDGLPSYEAYEFLKSQLGKMTKRHVLLRCPPEIPDPGKPLYRFFPQRKEERTVCGMSGGPIFGFLPGKPGAKLVAIQSNQKEFDKGNDKYVRFLTAVEAQSAIREIERAIKQTVSDQKSRSANDECT